MIDRTSFGGIYIYVGREVKNKLHTVTNQRSCLFIQPPVRDDCRCKLVLRFLRHDLQHKVDRHQETSFKLYLAFQVVQFLSLHLILLPEFRLSGVELSDRLLDRFRKISQFGILLSGT